MSFSAEWENAYVANTQLSIWPWSDMVSYVMRYSKPQSASFKVLEIGCGAGANIPFFKHMDVQYYAIEGSESITKKLWERFPELKKTISVGDFTQHIPFEETFDLVIDRAALTHNTNEAIKKSLSLIHEKLTSGGKFIGIDWFSMLHSDYNKGNADEDKYTRTGYTEGQFKGVGKVHFSDKAHLQDLFSDYKLEVLEHKEVKREIPDDKHQFASWNLVAVKP